MLLTVCIEAGRSTLTHTSWPGLASSARKWMSGQAAALATRKDRTPFANLTAALSLRDSTSPSASRPPSPLDFYLSWMSPIFRPLFSAPFLLPRASYDRYDSMGFGNINFFTASCLLFPRTGQLRSTWPKNETRYRAVYRRNILLIEALN
jgi:hypothetical protein